MLLDNESGSENIKELRDEEILALSVTRPQLFEVLVDRYQDAFLRKVRSIVGNRDDVYDIVQEGFTKIYMNARKFVPIEGASFKSWAYKIVINVALSYYQKFKRQGQFMVQLEPDFYESLADSGADSLDSGLSKDVVLSVLCRMPAMFSKMLKMHFIEGLPQADIAIKEGITVGAVKTRMYRAKRIFKKIYETF